VVCRPAGPVELDASSFAMGVDEPGEETRAVHADLSAGEIARDDRKPILLADAVLVAREANRRQGADDQQQSRN